MDLDTLLLDMEWIACLVVSATIFGALMWSVYDELLSAHFRRDKSR